LALALEKHNVSAERIHGDRSQAQRTRALADFKRGKVRVLVATDLAARGIDIVDLGHVVNFDVPMAAEDYVHRVGRTARAESTGDAITFVSREEEPLFRDIEKIVGRRIDRSSLPALPPAAPAPAFERPRTVSFRGPHSSHGRTASRRGR
jgi:ATP-dependent RNA helicase RhlE